MLPIQPAEAILKELFPNCGFVKTAIYPLPFTSEALGSVKEFHEHICQKAFLSVISTVVTLISYSKVWVVFFIVFIILNMCIMSALCF